MDAIELRRRGVELLARSCSVDAGRSDSSNGRYMAARTSEPFAGIQRAACALGDVRYLVDAATLLHEDFARTALGRGQARYRGFSDDPLDGFRDLAWAHFRTRPARNAAPERGTRRSNVRDYAR